MPATLRFQVLGPVRAWRGADEIELGPRKQRTVLAALLLQADQPVSCAEIMDVVWPDTGLITVPNALYTYVRGLRDALDPARRTWTREGLISSVYGGYVLRVKPDQVDAHRCRQLVFDARREWLAGRVEEPRRHLVEAMRVWSGRRVADLDARARRHPLAAAVEQDLLDGAVLAADIELASAKGAQLIARVARIAALAPQHIPLQQRLEEARRRIDHGDWA